MTTSNKTLRRERMNRNRFAACGGTNRVGALVLPTQQGSAKNNRLAWMFAAAFTLLTAPLAFAGEASTSASAGSNGFGPGTATATAGYNGGGRGYARTQTRSGHVNFGRGVAFGIDRNGVSFSSSHAIAGRFGPAVARNFNMTIGFDGRVSRSSGTTVAGGSATRQAQAGGFARAVRGNPTSASTVSGRTGPRGFVQARTDAKSNYRRLFKTRFRRR
ncbi:MAG: hypothetical protein MI923_09760 [Phycisphaerales bacterium]|nr:hypothetical protein [Phycisphaerales bacterium]